MKRDSKRRKERILTSYSLDLLRPGPTRYVRDLIETLLWDPLIKKFKPLKISAHISSDMQDFTLTFYTLLIIPQC